MSRRSKSSPKPTRKTSPLKTRAATTQKQKRRPYTLSNKSLSVIRLETERFFWHLAFKRVNAVGETWRTAVDKTLLPWSAREAAESKNLLASMRGRKKAKFPPAAPPLRLSSSEISNFASSYWKVVDSAAGHLADRLALAMAFRQGLGQEQQKWIRGEVAEFAEKKSSREIVRGWIGVAISNPPEAEKLPGFGRLVREICKRLDRPAPLFEPTHKLRLAVALMGEERAKLVKGIPRGSIIFEQWKDKGSFSQPEAGTILDFSPRHIRTLVDQKKLTKTATGRIVNDERFRSMYRLRNEPAKN